MQQQPPQATLLPYTTLFRSFALRALGDLSEHRRAPSNIEWDIEAAEKAGYKHYTLKEIFEQPRAIADCLKISLRVDRKSTRLNSSHSSISYAVFCLKKKTRL